VHVANAIGKGQAQHEERLGETLLDEMRRVHRKAWELLARTESEGDHRGSIVALREVRECLESLGEMLANADAINGGPVRKGQCDFSVLSDEELWTLEALIAKAEGRPARLLDIAPTLLDLTDYEIPSSMQARSVGLKRELGGNE
jgi:hypothetical protein